MVKQLRPAIGDVRLQFGRRARQLRDVLMTEGLRGLTEKSRSAAARWLAPKNEIWEVRRADVLAADLTRPHQSETPRVVSGRPITINWVTSPPSPGSGGHTTTFRMVQYLQSHGYHNRVYLYDVYRGDHQYYKNIVRRYFNFDGPIAAVDDGMEDAHAIVATSWPTAYPVFNARCTGKRFYLVQDFEPYFFAASSFSVLAENTYRMGFHAITAGRWLAEKLGSEFGMTTDYFDFGCDTSRYHLLPGVKRSGVAFYCRPGAARRGFELSLMAIEEFAKRRPGIDLHFYGTKIGRLPYAIIDHGHVTPEQLNRIYNKCCAGLSLSLTNVSLVPHEMLAAGCIPVVNDAEHNRIVLQNPFVRYTPLEPHAIASELESIVTIADFQSLSHAAASSVQSHTWADAGSQVDVIFRKALESEGSCHVTEIGSPAAG